MVKPVIYMEAAKSLTDKNQMKPNSHNFFMTVQKISTMNYDCKFVPPIEQWANFELKNCKKILVYSNLKNNQNWTKNSLMNQKLPIVFCTFLVKNMAHSTAGQKI